jgi:hypothetical protein
MGEIRRGSFGPARTDEIRWGWARYGSPGGERHDKDGNGWAVKDRSGVVVRVWIIKDWHERSQYESGND